MSVNPQAAYHFLPWARQGTAASIVAPPSLGKQALPAPGSTAIPGRAPVRLTLRLIGEKSDDVALPLALYGAGDVVGIDPREIVRTEPRDQTPDFPPHLLPFVEFDAPEFPWLFTPAGPDGDEALRPWIVLVVVRRQAATLVTDPLRPLPYLVTPLAELPDLEESWAWAHAQYAGSLATGDALCAALADRPLQTVSRLVCPRRLMPRQPGVDTAYVACLVPAFEAGRKAGLGLNLTDADAVLRPAWSASAAGGEVTLREVTLPVYFHWQFSTGEAGDFEALVDRLNLVDELPGEVRRMDLSHPGGGMPTFEGATLGLPSALRAPGTAEPPWPSGLAKSFADFQTNLRAALEASVAVRPPPPIYGRWQAGLTGLNRTAALTPGQLKPWVRDLNLDPRWRVAASLGVQIVQCQQEELVAAAWQQVGELQDANQWLRQKQVAREVSIVMHEGRLARMSAGTLLQVTAPAAGAVAETAVGMAERLAPVGTLESEAARPEGPNGRSEVGANAVSAPFRRLLRPTGPAWRSAGRLNVPDATRAAALPTTERAEAGQLVQRLLTGEIKAAPPIGATRAAAAISGYPPRVTPPSGIAEVPTARSVAESAASAVLAASQELLQQLDPRVTFLSDVQNRLDLPRDLAGVWSRPDPLEPVDVVPNFPQPMYEPLRDLFSDMFLPGLDRIPNNSLTLLEVEPRFIEAYMVGLNHELSHELLWREFPTSLRGTYFRQFWDASASLSTAPSADILEIASWSGGLGAHLPPERGGNLVMLLIRGDLLARYPNALIYAARAAWPPGGGTVPTLAAQGPRQFPILRVSPAPGVVLLGFSLVPQPGQAGVPPSGDAGWFFVFEEHPTETRFGLDEERGAGGAFTSWRDLTWGDVVTRPGAYGHISVVGSTPKPSGTTTQTPVWGKNGAHMAYITLQKPYRLLVHESRWFQVKQRSRPA